MKNKKIKKETGKRRILIGIIVFLVLLGALILIAKDYSEIKTALTGNVIEQSEILGNKSFVLWLNITGSNLMINNSTIGDEDIVIIFSNYDVKLTKSGLINSEEKENYLFDTPVYEDSKLRTKIINDLGVTLEEFDFDPLLRFFIWELNVSTREEFNNASLTIEYPITFSYNSNIKMVEISRDGELLFNYTFPDNYICNNNGKCENGYIGHEFIFEDAQLCPSDCPINAYDGVCNINISNSDYSYDDKSCDFDCTNDIEGGGECFALPNICGNNKTESGEECDDGNQIDNDGCSQSCKIEANIICVSEGQTIPTGSNRSCCLGLALIGPKEKTMTISGICTSKCGNDVCDTGTESALNCKSDCALVRGYVSPTDCRRNPSLPQCGRTKTESRDTVDVFQTIRCYKDSDCGASNSSKYCQNSTVACTSSYTSTCNNPGTTSASCSGSGGGGCSTCQAGYSCSSSTGTCIQSQTQNPSNINLTMTMQDTKTITLGDKTYKISVPALDSSRVRLKLNTFTTPYLTKGQTYKLNDGTTINIISIQYARWYSIWNRTPNSVTFSLSR